MTQDQKVIEENKDGEMKNEKRKLFKIWRFTFYEFFRLLKKILFYECLVGGHN